MLLVSFARMDDALNRHVLLVPIALMMKLASMVNVLLRHVKETKIAAMEKNAEMITAITLHLVNPTMTARRMRNVTLENVLSLHPVPLTQTVPRIRFVRKVNATNQSLAEMILNVYMVRNASIDVVLQSHVQEQPTAAQEATCVGKEHVHQSHAGMMTIVLTILDVQRVYVFQTLVWEITNVQAGSNVRTVNVYKTLVRLPLIAPLGRCAKIGNANQKNALMIVIVQKENYAKKIKI